MSDARKCMVRTIEEHGATPTLRPAEDAPPKPPLRDGGHVYLSCSNCRAGLMDFFVTRPGERSPWDGEPYVWQVQCNCPFCGDKSFVTTIEGGYHVGGFGLPRDGDENDTVPSTFWTGEITPTNGVLFHKVIKANENAIPQRVPRQ